MESGRTAVGSVETQALIPISKALPELRAADYAEVRKWDSQRIRLGKGYEAQDGAYLLKIQDKLAGSGLWMGYLAARNLPYQTAQDRINRAKASAQAVTESVTASLLETEVPLPSQESYSVEQWNDLLLELRLSLIEMGRDFKEGLNQQKTSNIEWALWSWNPVTGCLHNCPYCYARDIANERYVQKFVPTFLPNRLGAPIHRRVPAQADQELGYKNIFTCSMADLFGKWVPEEWIRAVLTVVEMCPQWNFLFLTKFPNRLAEFEFPDNAWLGTTVDCQARVKNAERSFQQVRGGVKWLSIEPMLEPLHFDSLEMFDWVVIGGASTSSETPAWIPPRRWVLDLESAAREAGCMIYEKTNLGIGGPSRLREYPGWERQEATLPAALKYLPSIG